MIKKQAPGETILKVGGMLLLFLGVMLAFGSGNTLSLATGGIYLAAGVVGVKQAGNIKNAGMCIGMGILLMAEVIAEVIVTMNFGEFDPASVIRMLMFPAIYMVGAVLNWQAKNAEKQ